MGDELCALLIDHFDGFEQTTSTVIAYSNNPEISLSPEILEYLERQQIGFEKTLIDDQDWNQVWEESFTPISIGSQVFIGAPHHNPETDYKYKIVIQPKMAFGTGHHPTTYMMAQKMLELQLENRTVFDFGTGTGVLAMLAVQQGAKNVLAVDNDPNCVENTKVNMGLNTIDDIEVLLGDIDLATNRQFDCILANVTKNVIQERLSQLATCLAPGGQLLMSGFFESDVEEIKQNASSFGLNVQDQLLRESWAQITFEKAN